MNKTPLEDRIWKNRLHYSTDHCVDRSLEIIGVYPNWIKNGNLAKKIAGAFGLITVPVMYILMAPLGILSNINSDDIYYEPLLQGYIMTNELREIRKKRGSDPQSRKLELSRI